MSKPSFSFVWRSFFLVPEPSSMTIFMRSCFVLYVNFVSMSPCVKQNSGFCDIIFSSRFANLISCGSLYITILGFLCFETVTSRSFPHLSLFQELIKLASYHVPVSMSTLPSFSDLNGLTHTIIAAGYFVWFHDSFNRFCVVITLRFHQYIKPFICACKKGSE